MKTYFLITAASLLVLSACSSNTVKDTLGLDRAPPDEFRVMSRPPLSVPPQFTLRPPATDDDQEGQASAAAKGKALVTGKPAAAGLQPGSADTAVQTVTVASPASSAAKTQGESALLNRAGAGQADPQVRSKIVADRRVIQQRQEEEGEDCSWWDIFCSPPKKEPVVNAKEEAGRIQKNAQEGNPVTTGDTPEVKPKDTGLVGRIFGY